MANTLRSKLPAQQDHGLMQEENKGRNNEGGIDNRHYDVPSSLADPAFDGNGPKAAERPFPLEDTADDTDAVKTELLDAWSEDRGEANADMGNVLTPVARPSSTNAGSSLPMDEGVIRTWALDDDMNRVQCRPVMVEDQTTPHRRTSRDSHAGGIGELPDLWSLLRNKHTSAYRFHLPLPEVLKVLPEVSSSGLTRLEKFRMGVIEETLGTDITTKPQPKDEENIVVDDLEFNDETLAQMSKVFTDVVDRVLTAMNQRHRIKLESVKSIPALVTRLMARSLISQASEVANFMIHISMSLVHQERDYDFGQGPVDDDDLVRHAIITAKRHSVIESQCSQLSSILGFSNKVIELLNRMVELEPYQGLREYWEEEGVQEAMIRQCKDLEQDTIKANRYKNSNRMIANSFPRPIRELLGRAGRNIFNLPDDITWDALSNRFAVDSQGSAGTLKKKNKGKKKRNKKKKALSDSLDSSESVRDGDSSEILPFEEDNEGEDIVNYVGTDNNFAALDAGGLRNIERKKAQDRSIRDEEERKKARRVELSMQNVKELNKKLADRKATREGSATGFATQRPPSPALSIVTVVPLQSHTQKTSQWPQLSEAELKERQKLIWQLAHPDKDMSEYEARSFHSLASIITEQEKEKQQLNHQRTSAEPGIINVSQSMIPSIVRGAQRAGIPTLYDYTKVSHESGSQLLSHHPNGEILTPKAWRVGELKFITPPHINFSRIPSFLEGSEPNPNGLDTRSKWFQTPNTNLQSMRQIWERYSNDVLTKEQNAAFDQWTETIPKEYRKPGRVKDTMDYVVLKRFFSDTSRRHVNSNVGQSTGVYKGYRGNVYIGQQNEEEPAGKLWVDDNDLYDPIKVDANWFRANQSAWDEQDGKWVNIPEEMQTEPTATESTVDRHETAPFWGSDGQQSLVGDMGLHQQTFTGYPLLPLQSYVGMNFQQSGSHFYQASPANFPSIGWQPIVCDHSSVTPSPVCNSNAPDPGSWVLDGPTREYENTAGMEWNDFTRNSYGEHMPLFDPYVFGPLPILPTHKEQIREIGSASAKCQSGHHSEPRVELSQEPSRHSADQGLDGLLRDCARTTIKSWLRPRSLSDIGKVSWASFLPDGTGDQDGENDVTRQPMQEHRPPRPRRGSDSRFAGRS